LFGLLFWAGRRGGQLLVLALAVPLAMGGLSATQGTPQAINPPPSPAAINPNEMVQRLADRLKEHPEDMDGWAMLARSYMALGRYAEAENAYERAQSKVMQDPDQLLNWIELRIMLGGRKFDPRSLDLLKQATQLAPDNTDVLLLNALAAFDRGDKAQTGALVAKLHERFPAGSPERQDLDAALDKWMNPAAPAASPPTLPASGATPPPDINAMVQRLADRLKDHPEDTNGWLMLARSYAELGRYAEADAAYERARDKALQDSAQLAIWVEMRLRMNGMKFDARAQELLDRAAQLSPGNPDILLLRALSAYGRGDKPGGDALVAKLREQFPPGTPERASLDAALRQLMPADAGKP
jgi:cytochrome c-type biogenesis protein CcmH